MGVGRNHHADNGQSRKIGAKATGANTSGASARRSVKIVIQSEFPAGRAAEERILKAIADCGFNQDSAWAVRLALQEAIMNAIKHGNHSDKSKKVRIKAVVTPKQAAITIEDEGTGFERQHVPDPRHHENLEKCSGRGIFLIESYMNKVVWSNGGRRLHMVRKNEKHGPHPS